MLWHTVSRETVSLAVRRGRHETQLELWRQAAPEESTGARCFTAKGCGCPEKSLVSHRGLLHAAPVACPGQGSGAEPCSGNRQTLSGCTGGGLAPRGSCRCGDSGFCDTITASLLVPLQHSGPAHAAVPPR